MEKHPSRNNYRGQSPPTPNSILKLAEELKTFARFETTPPLHILTLTSHSPMILSLQEHEVRRRLKAVNPRRAADPCGIPGAMGKVCTDQLVGILTRLFNLSLTHATLLTFLKAFTIIPIPKKTGIDSLKDYRPIAHTSVVMKCLEWIVCQHIRDYLPPSLDPPPI